jgi:lipoteichoic acid synthase
VVTPKYTILGADIYDTSTGQLITEPSEAVKKEVEGLKEAASKQLQMSDQVTNGDLLRFYTDSGLKPILPEDYNYKNQLEQLEKIEKDKGADSTSVYSEHQDKSTVDEYHTDTYQGYLKKGQE